MIHLLLLPDAGVDEVVCRDNYIMHGNQPVIGNGLWSTTGPAIIDNPSDPHSAVHNLAAGPNLFRWTISNGPCVSVDEVIITRDLQPAFAAAGPDQSFCAVSSATLQGNAATNNGRGTWKVVAGNAVFADDHIATTTASVAFGRGEQAFMDDYQPLRGLPDHVRYNADPAGYCAGSGQWRDPTGVYATLQV